MAEDFHRDVSRINQSVGGIAADANEILRLRDHAQGQGRRSGEGQLPARPGIQRRPGLRSGGRHRRRRAPGRGSQPLGRRSARDLAAQIAGIQNMRADVQMMALNTTLKCSRIGETGKPLGVIAVELRAHAIHLETSAARTTYSSLEGLSASEALGRRGRRRSQAGQGRRGHALSEAVARIKQDRRRGRQATWTPRNQGGEVVDMLARRRALRLPTPGRRLCSTAAANELEQLSADDDVGRLGSGPAPLLSQWPASTPWPRSARSTRRDGAAGRPQRPRGRAVVEAAAVRTTTTVSSRRGSSTAKKDDPRAVRLAGR
jgi:hypothetical protein